MPPGDCSSSPISNPLIIPISSVFKMCPKFNHNNLLHNYLNPNRHHLICTLATSSFPPKAGSPRGITSLLDIFQCDPQLKIQAKPNAYKPLQDQTITYLSYARTLLLAHLAPATLAFSLSLDHTHKFILTSRPLHLQFPGPTMLFPHLSTVLGSAQMPLPQGGEVFPDRLSYPTL